MESNRKAPLRNSDGWTFGSFSLWKKIPLLFRDYIKDKITAELPILQYRLSQVQEGFMDAGSVLGRDLEERHTTALCQILTLLSAEEGYILAVATKITLHSTWNQFQSCHKSL